VSATRQSGQASVELIAMLPLALLVAVVVAQLLAVGAARELAGGAATAGAAALLQDRDPQDEARAALPGWSRGRVTVSVRGRRVTVRVRPLAVAGPLARAFTAVASADAGPSAAAGARRPDAANAP